MSMATLLEPFGGGLKCDDPSRNTFDIHGGGVDLVFPHHENEIAQSCCAFHSTRMANVWVHNGFLQVESEKMSKSRGNFVTIRELMRDWHGQAWSGASIRFAMLETNYRQPLDWTLRRLSQARTSLQSIARITQFEEAELVQLAWQSEVKPSDYLLSLLNDDLNTAATISYIREIISKPLSEFDDDTRVQLVHDVRFLGLIKDDKHRDNLRMRVYSSNYSNYSSNVLKEALHYGDLRRVGYANNDSYAVEQANRWLKDNSIEINELDRIIVNDQTSVNVAELIKSREMARARKDWKESDRIRTEIESLGYSVKDNKDGTTTWEPKR
jgi:cysteinyl-tRNA synthetase